MKLLKLVTVIEMAFLIELSDYYYLFTLFEINTISIDFIIYYNLLQYSKHIHINI